MAEVLDDFIREYGFQGIGGYWHEVDRACAQATLAAVLHRDMAYGVEMMPLTKAAEVARRFLALFHVAPRFFTNEALGQSPLPGVITSGYGISKATFDRGIACLDDAYIGMLWVHDED